MKRLFRKLFTRKPKYEPAGIVHCGEWWFGDYYAQATPEGSYHVWHHDEYLGVYRLPDDKPLLHNGKAYRK